MTLQEARKKRGITQTAVANALQVTRQTYAVYERDPSSMSVKQAKIACDFMGYSFDEIFFPYDVHVSQHSEQQRRKTHEDD